MSDHNAVEEVSRVYEVATEMGNYITITAESNKSEDSYGYTIEGIDGISISVNDTENLIEAISRATNWINSNSMD